MSARIDPLAQQAVVGGRTYRLLLDCRAEAALVTVGEREYRVRLLQWREKAMLARFASLGEELVMREFVRMCADATEELPQEAATVLWEVAAWINDPSRAGAGVPLDSRAVATVMLQLCRATQLRPADFDGRSALEVEEMWQALGGEIAPARETANTNANRIMIVPDPVDVANTVPTSEQPASSPPSPNVASATALPLESRGETAPSQPARTPGFEVPTATPADAISVAPTERWRLAPGPRGVSSIPAANGGTPSTRAATMPAFCTTTFEKTDTERCALGGLPSTASVPHADQGGDPRSIQPTRTPVFRTTTQVAQEEGDTERLHLTRALSAVSALELENGGETPAGQTMATPALDGTTLLHTGRALVPRTHAPHTTQAADGTPTTGQDTAPRENEGVLLSDLTTPDRLSAMSLVGSTSASVHGVLPRSHEALQAQASALLTQAVQLRAVLPATPTPAATADLERPAAPQPLRLARGAESVRSTASRVHGPARSTVAATKSFDSSFDRESLFDELADRLAEAAADMGIGEV